MTRPDAPNLEVVCALAHGGVIGALGGLPWPHLKADMRHFAALTTGHTVVMGRKTAESLPHALPGRHNIVLTRQPHWQHPQDPQGFTRHHTLTPGTAGRLFVIGGAEIYRLLAPSVTTLHLTIVHAAFPGDTFFPHEAFTGEWQLTYRRFRPADQLAPLDLTFVTLHRFIQ